MKRIRFDESRVLILGTLDEIARVPSPSTPFAVLLATAPESPTPAKRAIESLAGSNCREMCFYGVAAESVHDLGDDVAEERGLLEIVTTWHTNETPEEVAFYFVECAGGVPRLLLAGVEHEPPLSAALQRILSGRET